MELNFFETVVNSVLSAILVTDRELHYIYANKRFFDIFGYTPETMSANQLSTLLIDSLGQDTIVEMRGSALEKGSSDDFILSVNHNDGSATKFITRCNTIMSDKYFMWSGTIVEDLLNSQRERTEALERLNIVVKRLKNQELMTNIALEGSGGFTWEHDIEGTYMKLGDTFETVTGYSPSLLGNSFERFKALLEKSSSDKNAERMISYLSGESDAFSSEYSIIDSNGNRKWFIVRGKFTDDTQRVIAGVTFDITERKLREKELSDMAYRDALTGLYNIQYLTSPQCSEDFKGDVSTSIIVADVMGFRKINELFGHNFGNLVLIHLVNVIKEIFENSLIVRVAGDEFLICLQSTSAEAAHLARKLCDAFSEPLTIDNQLVNIDVRAGAACSAESDENNIIRLFKNAEIALYYAKQSDQDRVYVYNRELRMELDDRIKLEFELHRALENNEFVLYFQPNIDAKSKMVIGAEALIRWRHPTRGLVSPLDFIPLAEETGLIIQIGEFVISEAAKNLKQWRDNGYDIFISINVSARQFSVTDFTDKLRYWIDYYELPSTSIIIEITESLMITDFTRISALLGDIREGGIKVSLDDFGTGYSSMNYLGKMPIDNLKIDKAFLDNVLSNNNDKAILESIITLAQKLGFYVTAEGVEKPEQVRLLEECGCDVLQGYLFSKPLPVDQFNDFLKINLGK